jgi:hypothetical protein
MRSRKGERSENTQRGMIFAVVLMLITTIGAVGVRGYEGQRSGEIELSTEFGDVRVGNIFTDL